MDHDCCAPHFSRMCQCGNGLVQVRELSAGSGAGGSQTPRITSALGSAEGAAIAAATLKQRQACDQAAALICQAKKRGCPHECQQPLSQPGPCPLLPLPGTRSALQSAQQAPSFAATRMLIRKWFRHWMSGRYIGKGSTCSSTRAGCAPCAGRARRSGGVASGAADSGGGGCSAAGARC